jgi:hypothetical protein
MLLFLGGGTGELLRKLQFPHLGRHRGWNYVAVGNIHQVPNDGSILGQLIPEAK